MAIKYTYPPIPPLLEPLDKDLKNLNPVCLEILQRRGYRDNQSIRECLFPKIEEAIQPFKCLGIEKAVGILENAIRSGKHIVVYRDYDVDGVSAGAIALECLNGLGASVGQYANARNVDGYGICQNGIDTIMRQWPETSVILTVDNGITGLDAITYAKSLGLTVVVTDHHETPEQLPPADAIVDLKQKGETYPFHDLCGAGVIFRVMLELYRTMKKDPSPVFGCLDIAALATIADVVPLVGENRAIVQNGLERIKNGHRLFFRIMNRVCESKNLNSRTIAFVYAPMINAVSRMGGDTDLVVDAMLSKNESFIEQQAIQFRDFNEERKDLTEKQYNMALEMIDQDHLGSCIVIAGDQFDDGIVGILAGRLKDQFWRPAIILSKGKNGMYHGSGRSIEEFHLKEALDECADTLVAHGGHNKAAGLTLTEDKLEAFKKKFEEVADRRLQGVELKPTRELSACIGETDLTEQLVQDLKAFEPFGEGFPEPILGLKAQPVSVRFMGTESQHVKFMCADGSTSIIGWGQAEKYKKKDRLPCKFVGKPSLNFYNGQTNVVFILDK